MGRRQIVFLSLIALQKIGRPFFLLFKKVWDVCLVILITFFPSKEDSHFVSSSAQPFVSIIIVNFNGRALLEECLPSVFALDFPKHRYEVIVVDNNSSDDSVQYVKKNFPQVKLLEASENLGFTGGNNLGFSHAKGEYIVLLNSDVVVDKRWLRELVNSAQPADVGLVSSKLYYNIPFIELTLSTPTISRNDLNDSVDFSPVGIMIEDVVCENSQLSNQVWYGPEFSQQKISDVATRWTKGKAHILVPFPLVAGKKSAHSYKITVHGHDTDYKLVTPLTIKLEKNTLVKEVVSSREVQQYELKISESMARPHFVWLVQNAGNIVLHDGYGKDRGSLLDSTNARLQEFYEKDSAYFWEPSELVAVCGASCLIKRAVVNHIGFLDGNYFMYYEDMDFSLRAWRAGWRLLYAPQSIGYHKHRATTGKNFSSFFIYLTEKNHLAFILTHFPMRVFLQELTLLCARLVVTGAKMSAYFFSENLERFVYWRAHFDGRKQAITSLVLQLPNLLRNRWFWQRREKRSYKQLRRYIY